MLKFVQQGDLHLARSDKYPDVVGSGFTPGEAEADFHERFATGWHEARRQRLIRAIRAGLAARERLAKTVEERAELSADRADLDHFIRMIGNNNLIAILDQ